MFNLIFGLIWTIFTNIILIIFVKDAFKLNVGTFVNLNPLMVPFFVLFEFVGIYLLFKGIRSVIKNSKTKRYGIECYGIVRDLCETGTYINGSSEYKAILEIVNPETLQLEGVEEIVGLNYDKYPIDSYVLCKYYNGDINFERVLDENEVPGDIKKRLVAMNYRPEQPHVEQSADGEYVTINGVRYKKDL